MSPCAFGVIYSVTIETVPFYLDFGNSGTRRLVVSHALVGFLSLRFTAGINANLSMSYRPDPATSPGRCYLEIFSLFDIYDSIAVFDKMVQ